MTWRFISVKPQRLKNRMQMYPWGRDNGSFLWRLYCFWVLEICEPRCANLPRGFSGCSTVPPPLVKGKHDPFSKGNHYASWLKSDISSLTFFWHLELKQTGATLSHCIIYAVHLASSTPKIFRSPHVYCSATFRVVHFMVSWTVNALVFLVNICIATLTL